MLITTRHCLYLSLLLIIVNCTPNISVYDAQCQRGWPAHYKVSQLIYDHLSRIGAIQYVALKGGNDRGNYSFYIVAVGEKEAIFLYANDQEIRSSNLPLPDAKRLLSELVEQTNNLKGYTGSGSNFSHLVCEYVKIKSGNILSSASFYNHTLPSITDPNNASGIDGLTAIRSKFSKLLDKTNSKEFLESALPHLADPGKLDSLRKTSSDLFYEIP